MLTYRAAVPGDAPECVRIRGLTRQNAVSADRLRSIGITAESWADGIRSGALPGYVCVEGDRIVGYCFGASDTGEIIVLALLPDYENRGIGRTLLATMVEHLHDAGFRRLFLGCSADPATRSYGFYRHLGWRSTGAFDAHGDEVLEHFADGRRAG